MQATRRHPKSAFADEKTEYVVSLSICRDKLSHRLAAFGDQHGFPLGLDFIHDRQTMDLKRSCRQSNSRQQTNYSPEAFALTGVESNSSAIQC
jgi:hypothetical protein